MSPTRKKMADLWFRLRKPFATVVVSLLVALGIVGASISASADVTPPTSATPTPPTFIDECVDGQATHAVVIPDDPYFRYITLGGIQSAGQYTVSLGQTVDVQVVSTIPVTPGATSRWSHTYTATCVVTPPDPPATPDPTVESFVGDWSTEQPTCDNPEVTQSRPRWTITTTYGWLWNPDTNQYDATSHVGDPVYGDPETRVVKYEGDCTTPLDFPATIKVCGPNYTLPNWPGFTLEIVKEGPDVGHVKATRQADGATHDYGKVPLGDCPTSPANPGDDGNPPSNGGGTPSDDGATPVVDTSAASASDDGTSPLTGIDAPSTGGRGDTTSPLNGWIGGAILSIVAAGAVTGGIIKVRRRRA